MPNQPAPCTQSELVEELNRLLAEEVEASLRYLNLSVALEPQDEDMLELMQEAFEETVEHALILGKKIRAVGGTPRMDVHLHCSGSAVNHADALQEVLTFEEAALEGYQELLERVQAANGDPDMIEFLRKQVELETEHVEEFRRMTEV